MQMLNLMHEFFQPTVQDRLVEIKVFPSKEKSLSMPTDRKNKTKQKNMHRRSKRKG